MKSVLLHTNMILQIFLNKIKLFKTIIKIKYQINQRYDNCIFIFVDFVVHTQYFISTVKAIKCIILCTILVPVITKNRKHCYHRKIIYFKMHPLKSIKYVFE